MSFADSHNAGNDAVAHIQAKTAILLALHSPKLSAVQNQGKLLAPLYFQLHLLLMCVIVESGRQEMAVYKQAPEAHQFYRMDH